MTLPRKVYRPIPIDDVDEEESSDRLPHLSGALKPVARRWPWLVHLGIFSLYTLAFLALTVKYLEQKPENLEEICLIRQSMHCMSEKFIAFV